MGLPSINRSDNKNCTKSIEAAQYYKYGYGRNVYCFTRNAKHEQ